MQHHHVIQTFRGAGSVANKTHSGARLTARTSARVQDLRTWLEQSPRKSTRRLSQEVGISSSVTRVTHSDLKLFPYKVHMLSAQSQANKDQDYKFCQSISERIENNLLSWTFFASVTRHISA